MKTTVILIALVLSLVTGGARAATTTDVSDHQHVPARSGDVLAYGADTVCKQGCWG